MPTATQPASGQTRSGPRPGWPHRLPGAQLPRRGLPFGGQTGLRAMVGTPWAFGAGAGGGGNPHCVGLTQHSWGPAEGPGVSRSQAENTGYVSAVTPSCSHARGLSPNLSVSPSVPALQHLPTHLHPHSPSHLLSRVCPPRASGPSGVLVPSLQAQQGPSHEGRSSLLLGRQRVQKLCPTTSELCPPSLGPAAHPQGCPAQGVRQTDQNPLRAWGSGQPSSSPCLRLSPGPKPHIPVASCGLPASSLSGPDKRPPLNLRAVPSPGRPISGPWPLPCPPHDSSSVNKSSSSCEAQCHRLLQRGDVPGLQGPADPRPPC